MKEVNKNFIYNILYQVFIYIIPLITTPYISRVLGANNIGIYSYTYSIVSYFMLAGLLGINNLGSRSIAQTNSLNDREKLSYKFTSIYLLQFILCVIMLVLYLIFSIFVFQDYRTIFFIQTIFLVSTMFDINWLYFGLENFKVTISRNIIIKLLSLVLIFMFVKQEQDLWIYTLIMSLSTLLSQLYLWLFVKKYVSFVKVKWQDLLANLKQALILFIPVIAYSIYRVMDKTMLGAMSGTTELGYYENAEKIINIPISFITAIGTVLLPHMSKNKKIQSKKYTDQMKNSIRLSLTLIIPMMFGLLAIANDFAIVFFGEEFVKSGNIILLLVPCILFSAISNIIRTSYLIPQEKDGIYVKSTIYGAVLNLIFNLIFIPQFQAYGACIGTIIAELTVMFYQCIKIKKEINLREILSPIFSYLIKGVIMCFIVILVGQFIPTISLRLFLQVITGIFIWIAMNISFIEEFFGRQRKKA